MFFNSSEQWKVYEQFYKQNSRGGEFLTYLFIYLFTFEYTLDKVCSICKFFLNLVIIIFSIVIC